MAGISWSQGKTLVGLLGEVKQIKWWHRIDLGKGIITPGVTDCKAKLAYSHLPDRMDNLRVLDIGAWDGWWSFLCEHRGAREVVALDTWGFDTGRRGFDLARKTLRSNVIAANLDVHRITQQKLGDFDLVLCLGALHHFKSPLVALERIFSVCAGKLILETHLDMLEVERPACAFYEHAEAYNDPTTRWGPNALCVEAWLRRAAFTSIEMVGRAPKQFESGGTRATFHASGHNLRGH